MRRFRLGTRGSTLATAQARIVATALTEIQPETQVELVPIVTSGDRYKGSLSSVGGKGLFTSQLAQALLDGEIDAAVHSAKDVPVDMPAELVIAAVPVRADARDALVSLQGSLADLPDGARVGTSSLRRRAMLLALRGDLKIAPLRGNVETRLAKVLSSRSPDGQPHLDAAVLATAGLMRCGLLQTHREHITALDIEHFVPAAGQGALIVQAAAGRKDVIELLGRVDHAESHQALTAERAVVRSLGADCHSCVGVYFWRRRGRWFGRAMAAAGDGWPIFSASEAEDSPAVVEAILRQLKPTGLTGL